MHKVQYVRKAKDEQASLFLKPVPPKLAELIELVNIVPPNCELPHPDDVESHDWCIKPDHDECTASALQSFKKFLKGLPANLIRYIWQINPSPSNQQSIHVSLDQSHASILRLTAEQALDINELIELGSDPVTAYEKVTGEKPGEFEIFCLSNLPDDSTPDTPAQFLLFDRYYEFWFIRHSLYLIAALSNAAPEQKERIKKLYGWKGINLPHGYSDLYIDEKGFFQATRDPVIEALEGVEAARIRTCEICDRIYWAGRIDQKCCSKKCARVQRTRRWREKYQSSYKLQRNGYEPIDKDKRATPKKKKGK